LRTLPLALTLALAWGGALAAKAQGGQKTLYERLGGYNAVAAVVDDFIGRLITDKKFERFFVGHSTDSKKRIRQHIVDQFCAAATRRRRQRKNVAQGVGPWG